MSTKEHPGRFDCYARLAPDEPYFVLRAKDPDAPTLIEAWAHTRAIRDGLSNPKIEEARETADAMRRWRREHVHADQLDDRDRTERKPDDEAYERPSLKDA